MSAKMKGLFKGLRYISHVFGAEAEPAEQLKIGFPTDVKHVAHIGWEGSSVDSPSWLKEFKAPGGFQSAPLAGPSGEPPEAAEVKWVSEDSKNKGREAITSARGSSNPDAPRTSRRRSVENSEGTSTRKGSRRHGKEPSDSVRSSRRQNPEQGLIIGESSSGSLSVSAPDIPKKTRRKKSKEVFNGGESSRASSSKPIAGTVTFKCSDKEANGESTRISRSKSKRTTKSITTCTSPSRFSDPGTETLDVSVGSPVKDDCARLSALALPSDIEEEDEEGSSGDS